MKRILPFFSIFLTLCAYGQSVKTLPTDPRIKREVMANGFTYYLVENEVRKGFADFYLIRRVGTLHEDSTQIGFNSIIAEMGIEGTRNFPNNTITNYFDELGLDYSADFQMINGLENSLYRIENIPVKRGGSVVDSTLLILYNWAANINLDEEDVEKGKEFYKNTLSREFSGDFWSKMAHLTHLTSLIEDTTHIPHYKLIDIDSYRAKDLRSFYYRWFSPDKMALIVVGDIKGTSMETKIKSLFQALPKFLEKEGERYLSFPQHDEPIVSVVEERGVSSSRLTLSFTTDPLPSELNSSAVPYVEDYMKSMMRELIMERLLLMSKSSSLPFYPFDVKYGRFFENSQVEALQIELLLSAADVNGVLNSVIDMCYNIKSSGFSPQEFEKVSKKYFRDLNYEYDWRIFTQNRVYADRCMDNFLYKNTLASIEMKKEYMDLVNYHVDVNHFNMFASSLFRNGDNCVVTYTIPKGVSSPSKVTNEIKHLLKEAIKRGGVEYLPPVSEFEFSQTIVEEGSVISKYPEMITGAQVWNLSNGATVVFKKSQAEPNKFTFEAVSKGGLTLLPSNSHARSFINELSDISPVRDLSATQITINLRDERLSLRREFDFNTTSLKGGGYSYSVKEFFQMVNSYFKPIKGDERAFTKYAEIKREELLSNKENPKRVFEDTLSKYIYYNSQYITTQSIEDLDLIDYSSAISFINNRFSNAASFYFVIVGDIDESLLEGLVKKYIATLPGNPSDKDNWRNVPVYLKKFNQEKVLKIDIPYPKNIYNLTITTPTAYNLKSVVEFNLASEIISKRVSREMRQRGFPVAVKTNWVVHPEEFITTSISSTSWNYSEHFMEELNEVLNDLVEKGPTSVEISNAKRVLISSYSRGEWESNEFWKELLVKRFIYGKDFYSRYSEFVSSGTKVQVVNSINKILTESYRSTLIMDGSK